MPTLGEKLGLAPRESRLLQKAASLGLSSPALLESLAVHRGCWHYRNPDVLDMPRVSESDFTNEELAVALLSPGLPYSPHTIRLGAAMLGANGNKVPTLARLAMAEGTIIPMRYIAEAALHFEPENPLWEELLAVLPQQKGTTDGVMPHRTRFVSMTGMTRGGLRPPAVWIRPRPDLAQIHG